MRLLRFSLFLLLTGLFPLLANAQPAEGVVSFRIQETSNVVTGNTRTIEWLATHEAKGAKAQFLISIQLAKNPDGSPAAFTKGYLARVAGSHPAALLQQLTVALVADKPRLSRSRVKKLPLDLTILGTNLTRETGGGFRSLPRGNWIATKLFLANGEGEVYLNLNSAEGSAEFSIKDEDYGNIVLRELSKVL